jgi:hypothetical protein
MDRLATIRESFAQLGLTYRVLEPADDLVVVDGFEEEGGDAVVSCMLFTDLEADLLRVFVYVDELADTDPLMQLKLVMTLNGELTTGAFCLDPEEETLYTTITLPAAEVTPGMLNWLINMLFDARDLYYEEFLASDEEPIAES